jgi:hypothetical protein
MHWGRTSIGVCGCGGGGGGGGGNLLMIFVPLDFAS